ncbi:MAG: hypothetical protein IMW91_09995 [Firmicutes bacterium]|nr:hypothetical protein [Bacillota bacterium]
MTTPSSPDHTPRLVERLWNLWEALFAKLYHVTPVPGSEGYRLSTTRYHGPEVYDENGRLVLQNGTPVIEVHVNNAGLRRIVDRYPSPKEGVFRILRQMRHEMHYVSFAIATDPRFDGYEVLYGRTLLSVAAPRLGWHVHTLPETQAKRFGWYDHLLMAVYHPQGRSYAQQREQKSGAAQLLWMRREELFQNFPPIDPRSEAANQ